MHHIRGYPTRSHSVGLGCQRVGLGAERSGLACGVATASRRLSFINASSRLGLTNPPSPQWQHQSQPSLSVEAVAALAYHRLAVPASVEASPPHMSNLSPPSPVKAVVPVCRD
ncbi:hypothetical protein PIB30_021344 [Stylosanthes scabra]|uniref:Uncharacterized protein n=1 Tax=Stylosanthes scabra TaxID=79078 RepID=A0ABU6Q9L2_9FABA|nr:hypothetical protein [Stylosanthes scabra]